MAGKQNKKSLNILNGIAIIVVFSAILACLFVNNNADAFLLWIKNFITGIFGTAAYFICIFVIAGGIYLIVRGKSQMKIGYKINFIFMAFSIMLLVHLITANNINGSVMAITQEYNYGQYISACYSHQFENFGGAFAALIIYPIYLGVGNIGSYVIYIGGIAVTTYFASLYFISKPIKEQKIKEKVTSKKKVEIKEEYQEEKSQENATENIPVMESVDYSQKETIRIPEPVKNINNDNSNRQMAFEQLFGDTPVDTKKDKNNEENKSAREILFTPEALEIGQRRRMEKNGTYTQRYEKEKTLESNNRNINTAPIGIFDNNPDGRPPKIVHENAFGFNPQNQRQAVSDSKSLGLYNRTETKRSSFGSPKHRSNVTENKDLIKYKEEEVFGDNSSLPPIINGDEFGKNSSYKAVVNEKPKEKKLNKYGYYEEESVNDNPIINADAEQYEKNYNIAENLDLSDSKLTDNLIDNQKIQTKERINIYDDENYNNHIEENNHHDENNSYNNINYTPASNNHFEQQNNIENHLYDESIDDVHNINKEHEHILDEDINDLNMRSTPQEEKISARPVAVVDDNPLSDGNSQMSVRQVDEDDIMPLREYPRKAYKAPPLALLKNPPMQNDTEEQKESIRRMGGILEQTLAEFNIKAEVKNIIRGPSVALYEMELAPGTPIKKVTAIQDDIARDISASGPLRILTHIPGKSLFGIEVPLKNAQTVYLKTVIESKAFKEQGKLRFALGIDIEGRCIAPDLGDMPHLLLGGSTGYGKSVCLNSLIISLMYKYSPEELKFILVDPKRVEFNDYMDMPHMLMPKPVNTSEKALNAFNWLVDEMERRYELLSSCHVRTIADYNAMIDKNVYMPLPRIVLIVDELSDLMALNKGELESKILRLTQKARAAGIHVVLATQRPSVDVITGTIKSNLPARIALKVISANDSKTIFDTGGPEKLCRKGDMLYQKDSAPIRLQGALVLDDEVQSIVAYIKANNDCHYNREAEKIINAEKKTEAIGNNDNNENNRENDPYFVEALKLAITSGTASISMIQRKFKIGFGRAGSLVEAMELKGYVGKQEMNKPRAVLISKERFNELYGSKYGEL